MSTNAADTTPRAVPTDIAEYSKFVADGGNDASAAKPNKTPSSDAAEEADENDSDSETEDQATGEKPRKKSGFQRRVTRLNREIGARDARIAELEKQLGAPGAKRDETPAKTADAKAEPAAAPEKPKLDDFKTYDEYVEALSEWQTERKLAERDEKRKTEQQQQAEQDKGKEITDAHNKRVDDAKERYTDWDKAFKGLDDTSFSDAMVVTIFESEVGPDITYYLATNRDELARIAKLSPVRQAAELGKLETRFTKEAAAAEDADDADDKPEPKPKTRVTTAPPPAKPLKGKATTEDAMPDPKDFAKYEAWARRKAAAAHRN